MRYLKTYENNDKNIDELNKQINSNINEIYLKIMNSY